MQSVVLSRRGCSREHSPHGTGGAQQLKLKEVRATDQLPCTRSLPAAKSCRAGTNYQEQRLHPRQRLLRSDELPGTSRFDKLTNANSARDYQTQKPADDKSLLPGCGGGPGSVPVCCCHPVMAVPVLFSFAPNYTHETSFHHFNARSAPFQCSCSSDR